MLKLAMNPIGMYILWSMERQPFEPDPYLQYSAEGFRISASLRELRRKYSNGDMSDDDLDAGLAEHAQRSFDYLSEGLDKFGDEFSIYTEAEGFSRAIAKEHKETFALKFNQTIYDSLGGPGRPIDAITNFSKLKNAVALLAVADHINSNNFYKQPNKVRELGDAVFGRVIQTMLSFNVFDFNKLRIPYRN